MGEVQHMAGGGHNAALGVGKRRFQQLEVVVRHDAIFTPLNQQKLGFDIAQDRAKVEPGEQANAMCQ